MTATEQRKRVRLDYDERRGQILASARRQFCARPYSEVSMHDLAEGAGVARGLLHHYFGSKRDLYLEVVRDLVRLPALPLPPDAEGLSAERRWELSVDGWMRHVESNRELWLTAIGAGTTGRDPEVEAIIDEGREAVAERALEAVGVGPEGLTPEVRAMARGFGGMAQEITREWLERDRLSREQTRTLLVGALPLLLDRLLPAVLALGL